MMTLLLFLAGLVLLIAGAELFVRHASRLAARLGVSPLVIGLTVVAYGTSAPELAVSVHASLNGQAAMTLGNVVGSNIFNVLCILGISALLRPLVVSQQLVRLDVPLMIGVSLLVFLFALNGVIAPWEGGVLCLGAVLYTMFARWQSRKESRAIQAEYEQEFGQAGRPTRPWGVQVLLLIVGLVLLVFGAQVLVRSAGQMAAAMGLSELIVGLTIIAAGTSLPEVAATHHRALPVFSTVMMAFVLPLTGMTLVVLWRRALRAQRQRPGTLEA